MRVPSPQGAPAELVLFHHLALRASRHRVFLLGLEQPDLVAALAATARELVGVDPDPVAVELARARLRATGFDRFSFRAAPDGGVPEVQAGAEVAVVWGRMERADDPAAMAARVLAAVRAGGKAFFPALSGVPLSGPSVRRAFDPASLAAAMPPAASPRVSAVPGGILLGEATVPGGPLPEEPEDPGPVPVGPDDPRVTVVIPTRNRAALLREAVLSVLRQTYGNAECLVMDDGSTDSTPEIEWEFPGRIRYFQGRAAGKGAALNAALVAATGHGEFILFLDDDDLLAPNAVVALVRALQAHPEWGMAASDAWVVDEAGAALDLSPVPDVPPAQALRALFRGCCLHPSAVMARRSLVRKTGAFDETLPRFVDYDFWSRACRFAALGTVHLPLASCRRHPGNAPDEALGPRLGIPA